MRTADLSGMLEAAGRALPELTFKAGLVIIAAGAAAFLLRRRSAAARHLVWATAMAGVLALPLIQRIPLRIAVLPASLGAAESPMASMSQALAPLPTSATAPAATRQAPAASPEPASAPAPVGSDRGMLLMLVWAAGTALFLLRLMVGTGTAWWLARTGTRIEDEGWTLAADRISRGFDAPSARLVRSDWTAMPMTWGFLRPVVLLPTDCDEWPAERRDVVLRHELAHVARRDVLTLALAEVARAVHWFNPLAWVALHQLRAEAERCCDDWVLRNGTRPSSYASHLLDMVRIIGRSRVPAAVALPMAQRSTFEGRLLAILEPGIERDAPNRARALTTLGGVAALVVLLGAMRPAVVGAAPTSATGPVASARTAGAPRIAASGPASPAALPEPAEPAEPEEEVKPVATVTVPRIPGGSTVSDTLTPDQLIAMRAVGVTPEYIRAMRAVFGRISPDAIVSMRAVGVTPEYVAALRARGVTGLTVEEVTGMRAVGVDAEYVQAMAAAGYPNLDAGELTSMRAVGVTPAYIQEMARHGIRGLDADALQGMRAVGVDGAYVEAMRAAGYADLRAESLTSLRAVGVTAAYVQEMSRLGIRPSDPDELSGMRAVGVDAAYVEEMRQSGLQGLDVETLTGLRATGVSAAYVRELSQAGLRGLTAEELTELRAHGVTAQYIRQLTEAGMGPLTADQLVRLRSSGADRELIRSRRSTRDPRPK